MAWSWDTPIAEAVSEPPDGTTGGGGVKRSAFRCSSGGRLLALSASLALGFPFGACRVIPPAGAPRDVPPDARTDFQTGVRHEQSGEARRALDAYREAIGRSPEYVDAHRAYQNLLLGRRRRGRLLDEYREFLAAAPGSAPRRYLLARLWSDPHRQLDGFEAALRADPRLYFGHIGIGYATLEIGDRDRSEVAFRRALELEPERVEARHGLLRVLSTRVASETSPEPEALARRLLERDPGDALAQRVLLSRSIERGDGRDACREVVRFALATPTEAAAQLAHEVLSAYGTPADFDDARALLGHVPGRDSSPWWRLGALVDERAGDPRGALQHVLATPPAVARLESTGRMRRRLLLAAGEFERWLDEVRERRYEVGFVTRDQGAAAARLAEVAAAADDPARVASAVDALLRLGLVDGGIALGRAALGRDPANAELRGLLDEALRQRRFVAELSARFETFYRRAETPSLDQVLDVLRELSIEVLGEDVVEPVVTKEYFPVGTFLDPDPAHGGGLARYFDRFGTFFLVGRRTLGVPEAYGLRRIAEARTEVDGTSVYRVVGEDLVVPSRSEQFGGEIAGFAFESFIVLNVDRVRTIAAATVSLREDEFGLGDELLIDPPLRVDTPEERLDLDEPLTLAARSHLRALLAHLAAGGTERTLPGLLLDAVESHEQAHIRDAARFLPLFDDLGTKVSLLGSHGFSPANVEAWLEERAQAVALADADSPLAVLAATASMLPGRLSAPPHSQGYHDLLARMVREVAASPERYPTIDPEAAILGQLDRLGNEGLRALARLLLSDEQGLPELQ